jgi:hypothetical protein
MGLSLTWLYTLRARNSPLKPNKRITPKNELNLAYHDFSFSDRPRLTIGHDIYYQKFNSTPIHQYGPN